MRRGFGKPGAFFSFLKLETDTPISAAARSKGSMRRFSVSSFVVLVDKSVLRMRAEVVTGLGGDGILANPDGASAPFGPGHWHRASPNLLQEGGGA